MVGICSGQLLLNKSRYTLPDKVLTAGQLPGHFAGLYPLGGCRDFRDFLLFFGTKLLGEICKA